jgi:adenine deaminase
MMVDREVLAAARGDRPATLLLKNANLVNVFTGEIYETDIAIQGAHIAAVGAGYEGQEVIDLKGRYVAPGFIDAHVHIESSMCTPREYARAVLPHGVTSVVADPHEIANVLGLEGISFMLENAKYGVLSVYVMASSCVPATHMGTAGARLGAYEIENLKGNPWVLGLAEMMNYPGVIAGQPDVLDKIEAFEGKVLDGHAPGLTGKRLNAYLSVGIRSDHECMVAEEAREKLRLGMTIFIREASNAHNLRELLPVVNPENSRRICFCTDDRHPGDLIEEGSIDHMVRMAIAEGLDPVMAIRMATLNTAEYFGLHDLGGIAPSRRADLVVFSDLSNPVPERVYRGGQLIAQDGIMQPGVETIRPIELRNSMNVDWGAVKFDIPAHSSRVRVIGSVPHQLLTEHLIEEAKIEDGQVVADVERDILKMAVIERHRATGHIGKGLINGIGLKRGAIAGTVAHDHHNLVVIGADDESMMTAARAVGRMGGLAAASGKKVIAELPLPVAGLMSDRPIEEIRASLDALLDAARELGSPLDDPFMAMSFMALEVIPKLKLTDLGLVDVERFELVDLFVD